MKHTVSVYLRSLGRAVLRGERPAGVAAHVPRPHRDGAANGRGAERRQCWHYQDCFRYPALTQPRKETRRCGGVYPANGNAASAAAGILAAVWLVRLAMASAALALLAVIRRAAYCAAFISVCKIRQLWRIDGILRNRTLTTWLTATIATLFGDCRRAIDARARMAACRTGRR